nr:AMP-binding protein [Brevibacterium sp. XM4083]
MCDRHAPQSVAFTVVDDDLVGTDLTYGELAERSRRIASVLADHGVVPGSRVASLMGKSADLPAVMLAIWRLGAVYVPLFTAFASGAVSDRLTRAEAVVVITDTAQRNKVPDGGWVTIVAGECDASDGALVLDELLDTAEAHADDGPGGPHTPIVHMFTSGTTGKPKSVVHPKSYAAGWQGYLEFALDAHGRDRVLWCGADPGWAYGLYCSIIAPLIAGVRSLMTVGPFDPAKTWEVLAEFGVTDFATAPTALRAMRMSDAARPLPLLRRVSSAGEPLTPEVFEWTRSLGAPVHDHFGQTELGMCAGFAHHPALAVDPVPASMGRSLPGWSLTVLGLDDEAPAEVGETGRLAVVVDSSAFFSFTGYGVDRDVHSDRFSTDGSHYLTGDLARIDDRGLLHFSSRDDDVILMAGYRIGPFEVEPALLSHEAVLEAAVVASPDEVRGEVAHAFIVLQPGYSAEAQLVRDLQLWVKAEYAAHAYPRRIDFIDALPKTESGKVKRAALRERLRDDDRSDLTAKNQEEQ